MQRLLSFGAAEIMTVEFSRGIFSVYFAFAVEGLLTRMKNWLNHLTCTFFFISLLDFRYYIKYLGTYSNMILELIFLSRASKIKCCTITTTIDLSDAERR